MLFARRKPDDIARPDFLDRTAPALRPPDARSDDRRLPERMGMPRGAGTRFESDTGASTASGLRRLEKRVDADIAGEIVRWPFARKLKRISESLNAIGA
jgi:hypothetical protein